ncbi:TRAP transporter substrate-binding protein [Candidatus Marithrix sp. Canyon 246]|uniref:TRAP transporter substrate-binding protein n=1 Tax=Candidatus Marithrix sp. Canyon 246 TaxID=1827136 RepID=UPI00084A04FC|nr:TRAP transporter substrate-binding protein [Candidatus Marithrix sp. Canyon 246]
MKFLTVCLALLALSACQDDKIIKIKFSHIVADNTPKGIGAKRFKQLVEERLKGKVVVEIYPNAQLYDDNKVMEALLLGDVQLAAPSLAKFKKYTKKLQVFDLPFLFKDIHAVDRFQAGEVGQKLLTSMDKYGYLGLTYWHNGMKQLSANTALRIPTDAKGLKFRIQQSDVIQAQFQAVGASPQKLAYTEVYNALQTGVVDGQENTWSNIRSKKFYEVQKYFSETNHGIIDYLIVTNAKFWRGLPADIRIELEKILVEVGKEVNQLAQEIAKKDRQTVIDSGRTKVLQLTADELAQWRTAMQPVWKQFEDDIGKEVIEAANKDNVSR